MSPFVGRFLLKSKFFSAQLLRGHFRLKDWLFVQFARVDVTAEEVILIALNRGVDCSSTSTSHVRPTPLE